MRDFINDRLTNEVVKSIYPYSELSIQELLNRFYSEIKNTNEISNKALKFLEWLVEQGLEDSVVEQLNLMYEDGRLEQLVNVQKYNELDNKYQDITNNIVSKMDIIPTNFDELKTLLLTNDVITIDREITVTENYEIPKGKTLVIKENGLLTVGGYLTLTLNCNIQAGYYQIFNITENGQIISTKNSIGYNVKVDWFGCDTNCYVPADNEYLDVGICYGGDSTEAFKNCMKFVESGCNTFESLNPRRNQSTVIVEFKPNGNYYCIGDNPLGVQSQIANLGFFINVKGNNACIFWKPLAKENALFKKYGRIVSPSILDLNVYLIGNKGQRWGRFVDSKTYENDTYHYSTQAMYRNLKLNVQYGQVGYDIVFNMGIDQIPSHDDTSLIENVYAGSYNTFMKLANGESVNWEVNKCQFTSYTDNSIHFDVLDSYSGGINITNSDILLANENEVFYKTTGNVSLIPTNITGCRIESRNQVNIKLLDMESGRVILDGLNIYAGNYNIPLDSVRLLTIGEKAQAIIKNSELYDKVQIKLNKTGDYTHNNAIIYDGCSFVAEVLPGEKVQLGYPTIKYLCDGIELVIDDVIKQGYKLRGIEVKNPRYVNTWLCYDMDYGNSYATEFTKVRLNNVTDSGYTKLALGGSLPPNLAIYNLNISYSGADTNNVTSLFVKFYNRKYNKEYTIEHNITTSPQYNLKIGGGVTVLPLDNFNEISVFYMKDGVLVTNTDLHPNGYIEMEIKGINNRAELPITKQSIETKDNLVFN